MGERLVNAVADGNDHAQMEAVPKLRALMGSVTVYPAERRRGEVTGRIAPASRLMPRCMLTVERVAGIEPASQAWKASALPLSYTRNAKANGPAIIPGRSSISQSYVPPRSILRRFDISIITAPWPDLP